MKDITYPNALASSGQVVNIYDKEFQDRNLKFTCIGCGQPMEAVHKTKGRSYYRHTCTNPSCNPQTYLHRLAKYIFKKKFDLKEPFYIAYKSENACGFYRECSFRRSSDSFKCFTEGVKKLDLHSRYDTCKEEVKYNGYVADILLTNSKDPSIKPLFVEIAVTHRCDEEKIKSGISIIELDIKEENDIYSPIIEGGVNGQPTRPAVFYNFDRIEVMPRLRDEASLIKVSLYRGCSGKLNPFVEYGKCSKAFGQRMRNCVFESFYLKDEVEKLPENEIIMHTWAKFFNTGKRVRVCYFCAYAQSSILATNEGLFSCSKSRTVKSPMLNGCNSFVYDDRIRQTIIAKYRNYHYMVRRYI